MCSSEGGNTGEGGGNDGHAAAQSSRSGTFLTTSRCRLLPTAREPGRQPFCEADQDQHNHSAREHYAERRGGNSKRNEPMPDSLSLTLHSRRVRLNCRVQWHPVVVNPGLDGVFSAALLQLYIVSIAIMLYRLYWYSSRKDEQLSIGVGAKMGNGLLVTLLGVLILSNQGADWITQFIFGLALTAIYVLNFVDFLRHPEWAVVGYKG